MPARVARHEPPPQARQRPPQRVPWVGGLSVSSCVSVTASGIGVGFYPMCPAQAAPAALYPRYWLSGSTA
jgi:hypothetical protein